MEDVKTPEQELQDKIDAKVIELEKKHSCVITPVHFKTPEGEDVIGYLKTPNRVTKLRTLDQYTRSRATAAAQLLDLVIIKEESDPRIYSELPENDDYYIGASFAANNLVGIADNIFKKK